MFSFLFLFFFLCSIQAFNKCCIDSARTEYEACINCSLEVKLCLGNAMMIIDDDDEEGNDSNGIGDII